jgi:hypothetical protein
MLGDEVIHIDIAADVEAEVRRPRDREPRVCPTIGVTLGFALVAKERAMTVGGRVDLVC